MVQTNTAWHRLTLICAFTFISLAHSFVPVLNNPNKVVPSSISSPLALLSGHQPKKWCGRTNNKDCFIRFASSSSDDTEVLGVATATFSDSPEQIFQQLLVGDSFVVGLEELKQWEELQDLIADEDILQSELEDMVSEISISEDTGGGKIDHAGFVSLYKMIDNLFEYEDNTEEEIITTATDENNAATEQTGSTSEVPKQEELLNAKLEEDLLSFLTNIQSVTDTSPSFLTSIMEPEIMVAEKMPCGMDCTDTERETIGNMISALEISSQNLVVKQNGNIEVKNVLGDWDLIYTNSKAMIINKCLSGLQGSPSQKAEFSGVRQRLTGSKFLGFVEYLETFNAGTDETFDVTITGEWELKENKNYFTGAPATAIQVDPNDIEYGSGFSMTEQAPVVQLGGGLSQGASWQSLGPIKLLDFIYLSPDLQIVRGNAKTESIFIWKKK